ncbi:MAG: DUF4419 domain-containing protein [Pirellula sp.]
MILSTVQETTFEVSKVPLATEPRSTCPYQEAIESFLGHRVEACSGKDRKLIKNFDPHPLVGAVALAYARHYPLVLSPDIVWLTITQGLARHIQSNAEDLRHHFVSHQGKATITVVRNDFVKGSPDNPWPEVFSEFSTQVKKYIGDAHDLIVSDFSTTGPVERAASEIVLLDSMQSYFDLLFVTICGIPSITLEGTVEDWQSIARRAEALAKYDLDWWISPLLPILRQFANAAMGQVDTEFWQSIYQKPKVGSGREYITGWIVHMFPYLWDEPRNMVRNPWVLNTKKRGGPILEEFPTAPGSAPFQWNHLGTTYNMEFVGGLLGVSQCEQTFAVRPEIGWAVREVKPAK